jgi:hypothetical protein
MSLNAVLIIWSVKEFYVKNKPKLEARVRRGRLDARCILTSTPCLIEVMPVIVIENTPELIV